MNGKNTLVLIFLFALFFQGCRKPYGSLSLHFISSFGEENIKLDTCVYVNAAGNKFEVSDVQYFISGLALVDADGKEFQLIENEGIHYFDKRISTTHLRHFTDIPQGNYKHLKFIFGLDGKQNITGYFTNPPENNMFWPEALGGGYHYMKINGKWLTPDGQLLPFNLHLGKIKASDSSYKDNTFEVILPLEDFYLSEDKVPNLNICFNIQNWFQNPHIFDFNEYGGAIMDNTDAQLLLKNNGHDVFSLKN